MCHVAVSLEFMVVLKEMGITETIGLTEHVNSVLCKLCSFA